MVTYHHTLTCMHIVTKCLTSHQSPGLSDINRMFHECLHKLYQQSSEQILPLPRSPIRPLALMSTYDLIFSGGLCVYTACIYGLPLYLWVFTVYQSSLRFTSSPYGLPVLLMVYQSSLGFTGSPYGLPVLLTVYQSSLWFTSSP